MKRLLYHVSDKRHDILDPIESPLGCICFSEGAFVGYFGEFLYIFEYEVLLKNYDIVLMPSNGLNARVLAGKHSYVFTGQLLGKEYRSYLPVDVNKHALDVAENFNVLKGVLEKRLQGEIINRERIDLRPFSEW